jgi:hypothetical protein
MCVPKNYVHVCLAVKKLIEALEKKKMHTSKVVKNAFSIRHGKYNINSDHNIIKS